MTNPDATTRNYWSIVSPCTIRDLTRNVSQSWPKASDVPLLILAKKKKNPPQTWNATHHRPLAERGPITCLFQRLPPLYGNRSVDHLPCGSPALATPGGRRRELPHPCVAVAESCKAPRGRTGSVRGESKLALVIITYCTRVSCQSLRYSNTNPVSGSPKVQPPLTMPLTKEEVPCSLPGTQKKGTKRPLYAKSETHDSIVNKLCCARLTRPRRQRRWAA